MKKNILCFILGGIIFSSITATAAYVYTARDINYQPSDEDWSVNNVQEALTELKTDVNTITNKVDGIERVYKAGEVELVALVSDDSFYKDSNGKYVLSNSDTGRTLLADTSTYKSLASTEDCLGIFDADTCSPFKQTLIDINPNKEQTADTRQGMARNNVKIPICGYKKIALSNNGTGQNKIKYRFIYNDGTYGSYSASISDWTDWILIPQNALMCEIAYDSGGYNETIFYYSLLA